MKNGQVAVEFLLIIGILSLAIIPVLFAMHWNSQNSPDRLVLTKAAFSASRLASSANSVGSLGPGSKMRVQVELPPVHSVVASGEDISVNAITSYGTAAIVQTCDYSLSSQGFERMGAEGTYTIDVWSDEIGTVNMRLVD